MSHFLKVNQTFLSVPKEDRTRQLERTSPTRDKHDKYFSIHDQSKVSDYSNFPDKMKYKHCAKIAIANANMLYNVTSPCRVNIRDIHIIGGPFKEENDHTVAAPSQSVCPGRVANAPREWIADAGCAYVVVARSELPKRLTRKIFKGADSVPLRTANGYIECNDKVHIKTDKKALRLILT